MEGEPRGFDPSMVMNAPEADHSMPPGVNPEKPLTAAPENLHDMVMNAHGADHSVPEGMDPSQPLNPEELEDDREQAA